MSALDVPVVGYRRLRRAVQVRGVRGAVRAAAHRVKTYRAHRRWLAQDRAWDADHGVDTAGIVPLQALEIASENRDVGVRYQASSPEGFRGLMSAVEIG